MTRTQDPVEIYRESLANIPAAVEARPPTIRRAEAWPYPELDRLWVRLETDPFAAFPNLSLTLTDPDGLVVSTMFLVEIRQPYQSLTMHLRRSPRPGERYTLEIELSRDEVVLDTQVISLELSFREPQP